MMQSANLTERIEKCERILKENANSQIFAPLADAMRVKGDLDEAFRICRQGLRLHPNYGPGHLVMARINYERRMYDWAEQELNESVRLEGQTRATEQLRVEILIAKENFSESEIAIKRLKSTGANPLLIQELTQRLEKQKKELRRRRPENLSSSTSGQQRTVTPPKPSEFQKQPLTLEQALDKFYQTQGIQFIVCAHRDGTVVDHRGETSLNVSEVAAFCVEMCRASQDNNFIACLGESQQTAIETDERAIVIMQFTRYNLVLFCDKVVNLGSLRLHLDEIIRNLPDGQ